ncbi:MAG: DUF4422 domain-containing protein [bacterium]|nr:DUF4422 domain-containing protein [bacterium]
MDTKLLVCTHKDVSIPFLDGKDEYTIIQSGPVSAPNLGFIRADSFCNIGYLNEYFSEVEVHYWAWKNLKCDVIGILHYHRFLCYEDKLITKDVIETLLEDNDFLVPTYYTTKVPIKMLFMRYSSLVSFDLLHTILSKKYPEYLSTYYDLIGEQQFINFNILVCKKSLFDSYCEWLFGILFEFLDKVKKEPYCQSIPPSNRICGYLSEILFGVYLSYNNYKYLNLPLKIYDATEFDR